MWTTKLYNIFSHDFGQTKCTSAKRSRSCWSILPGVSEVRTESRSRWEQENAAESEMAGWTDGTQKIKKRRVGEMIAMTVRFLTLSQ